MIKHYLTIAVRTLRRHPGVAAINVVGLAVGMACCLLIALYVRHERAFDRFHTDADRIYRIVDGMRFGDAFAPSAITPSAWGPAVADHLPEVAAAARVRRQTRLQPLVRNEDHRNEDHRNEDHRNEDHRNEDHRNEDRAFYESRVIAADPGLFEVLTFEFVAGDPRTALAAPDGVVITEAAARKYFGDADPLGQTLRFDERTHRVTGLVRNPPSASSIPADFILPLDIARPNDVWTHTFVRLRADAAPADVEANLARLLRTRFAGAPYAPRQAMQPRLQPLLDIHLHSNLRFELGPTSSARTVYVLLLLAAFILGIAVVNFVNLATARATQRAREVGLRKVLGARRTQLIRQFLGESVLLSTLAFLAALGLAYLLLPGFNRLADRAIAFDLGGGLLTVLAGCALLVGLLSGSYPALHLSAFEPASVLKGTPGRTRAGSFVGPRRLRGGLMLVQFAVAIFLLIGADIVRDQLAFVRAQALGFQAEQVVVVPVRSDEVRVRHGALRNDLLQHPGVAAAAFAQSLPGRTEQMASLVYRPEARENTHILRTFAVDHDFLPTLGIELAAGRGFDPTRPADSSAFVLNQAAVRMLGWQDPLGKRLSEVNLGWEGEVVGVARDFHMTSLQHEIEPVVLHIVPSAWFNLLAVRVRPTDLDETLAYLESRWRAYAPGHPFEYRFLNEDFDRLYRAEHRLAQILASASALAVVLACLGLFALMAFTTEQRRKEIGIRKALGASVADIVGLLTKDACRLVLLAFTAAAPVAYLAMRRWLETFAYHVEIGPAPFGMAVFIALSVAALTIGLHAVRAAGADPVESLRSA